MKTKIPDLIIVGAGPAGISCALRAKELNMEPLVLEQGVLANTIEDYSKGKKLFGVVGFFKAEPEKLVKFYKNDISRAGIDLREGQKVVSITKSGTLFDVKTGKDTFRSKAVVLATGIQGLPQTLGIRGENKKHVHYMLKNAQKYTGKKVVVAGGGDTAIEAALALEKAGAKTTISYRRHEFFRAKELNVRHLEESAVEVKFSTNLAEICDKKVILRHSTGGLEEIYADAVFILVGVAKNTDFYRGIGLELDKNENIIHDEKTLETSVAGLFAAGDIVSREKLIAPATYQGFVAASSVLLYKSRQKL